MNLRNWLLVGVAVVGVAVAGNCYRAQANDWEKRVERVQERNRVLEAAGEEHRARADSLEAVVDTMQKVIVRRDTVIRLIQQEIEDLPPEPEGCKVFTEPRDRLIYESQLQVADVQSALEKQRQATADLRKAEIAAVERADSLANTLADRPLPRPDWIPQLSAFGGVCTTGQLCAGIGLSWEARIF